ncbi:MAG: DUF3368 domain-containing protein [Verrucomicrobia bacterium]|nr:DUF3368 domain-containing protein [Verrucomicrobiota bacterium]
MIVISDTSAIVNLAVVGRVEILRQLYGKVLIPQAVRQEIGMADPSVLQQTNLLNLGWIETVAITDRVLLAAIRPQLDAGEAEAVALAVQTKADFLLMDERRGRRVATDLGLHVIGLLGILLEAKHRKLLPLVKPTLDDLISRAGFWISKSLYERVLSAAGE